MKTSPSNPLVLANWGRRFIAWFADYVIINVLLAYFDLEQIETSLLPPILLPHLPGTDITVWSPLSILVFFAYWALSEWYFGRSIGQLLVNVRLVNSRGRNPSLRASAIQSISKSNPLLLLIDVLVGWSCRPCRVKRQRFFNKLSNTIVIFVGDSQRIVKQGHFLKEP